MRIGNKLYLPVNWSPLSFLALGFVAGIFVLNIGKEVIVGELGIFDASTLYHIKNVNVDGYALFCYVFRKRMMSVLIIVVLSTTYLGLAVCRAALIWYGFSAGMYLAALFVQYGIKGLILAAVGVVPQCFVYFPALLLLVMTCEKIFRAIYGKGTDMYLEKRFWIKEVGLILVVIFMNCFGCLLEGFVNAGLLTAYLKTF